MKTLNYQRRTQSGADLLRTTVFSLLVISVLFLGTGAHSQIIGDNPLMDMRYRIENISNNGTLGYFDVVFQVRTIDGSSYIVTQMQNSIRLAPYFRGLIVDCDTSYWAVASENYIKIWGYNNSDGVISFQISHIDMQPGTYFGNPDPDQWQTVVRFSFTCRRELGQTGTIDWFDDTPHFNIRAFNPEINRTELIHNLEIGGPVELDLSFYRRVVDIRIKKGNVVADGTTGTFELWFDLCTSDGSAHYIHQIQDAVVFDTSLRDHIVSIEPAGSIFNEPDYGTFWRYTRQVGVLEFQVFHQDFRPFVQVGGPDSTTWHQAICFDVTFNLDPGQQGSIHWYDGTPHLNIRVADPGPPPSSEVLHRYETGAPIIVNFDVQGADLQVSQSFHPENIGKQQTAVLHVDLFNSGPEAATAIGVQNILPPGLEFQSYTLTDGYFSPATGQWTVSRIENNAGARLSLTVKGVQGGRWTSTSRIFQSNQQDPDTTNNSTQSDLCVTEQVMDMRVRQGEWVLDGQNGRMSLWIDVRTIDGSSRAICQMQNALELDSIFRNSILQVENGFSVFPAEDYQTNWNWTQSAGVLEFNSVIKMNGNTTWLGGPGAEQWHPVYRFDVSFQLAAGQQGLVEWYSFTPNFYISAADPSGQPEEIQHDELGAPLGVPLNGQADVAVESQVDKTTVGLNENIQFLLIVRNNGPDQVANVTIRDLLPQGLLFVSCSGPDYSPDTGDWTVGRLAVDSRDSLFVTAKAVQVGTMTNTCCIVSGNENDPVPANDQAAQTVTVSEDTRIFVRIYLEGPYRFAVNDPNHPSPDFMATKLRYPSLADECLIPLQSPYADSLHRDTGVTDPDDLPEDVVDWVFVQFRPDDGPFSPNIPLSNGIDGISCFLRRDGALVDLDGSEGVAVPGLVDGNYFIQINHRNHLHVMSSVAVNTAQLNAYNYDDAVKQYYDFTESKTQYFRIHDDNQRGCRTTPILNKWVLAAGDGDGACQVESADLDIWYSDFGLIGYYASDYDLGGMVEGRDQSMATDNLLVRSPFSWPDMNP